MNLPGGVGPEVADAFVFGMLCHADLRQVVLGRNHGGIPARLIGYRLWSGDGAAIVADGLCDVDGLFLKDLTAAEIARLDYYQAVWGNAAGRITLDVQGLRRSAISYFRAVPLAAAGSGWRFADWDARFGAEAVAAARDVMDLLGRAAPQSVAVRLVVPSRMITYPLVALRFSWQDRF